MQRYTIDIGGNEYIIDIQELGIDHFRVLVAGQEFEARLVEKPDAPETKGHVEIAPAALPQKESVSQSTPPYPMPCADDAQSDLTAPMPGTVLSIDVALGDTVACGQVVLILEAMKMKNALQAPQNGVVSDICVQQGQQVNTGDVLIRFSAER